MLLTFMIKQDLTIRQLNYLLSLKDGMMQKVYFISNIEFAKNPTRVNTSTSNAMGATGYGRGFNKDPIP